ncbi:hypothetical protein BS78_09G100700 [Paspalum vaginatum]|nr:hypothetical protein BS78_09G100700 [Paspalum vaginatum]
MATQANQPNAMIPLEVSRQSATSGMKRKAPATSAENSSKGKKKCSGQGVMYSDGTASTIDKPTMSSQRVVRTTAQGRVATIPGGSASINLEARVPSTLARAKVSIQVTSGTASGQVKAQEPSTKGATSKTSRRLPQLLLSPKAHYGFNNTQ